MEFEMRHLFFKESSVTVFDETNPPAWLTHRENLWWFNDHVLKLEVGQSIDSDFQQITRTK